MSGYAIVSSTNKEWTTSRSQPGPALKLAVKKLTYFVFFRPSIGSSYQSIDLKVGIAQQSFIASWLLLLPLGLAGLWIDRKR